MPAAKKAKTKSTKVAKKPSAKAPAVSKALAISAAEFSVANSKNTVVVFADKGNKLTPAAAAIDKAHKGAIAEAVKEGRFNGEAGQTTVVRGLGKSPANVVVVGLGESKKNTAANFFKVGVGIAAALYSMGVKEASVAIGKLGAKSSDAEIAAALYEGIRLGTYKDFSYKSDVKDAEKMVLSKVELLVDGKDLKEVKAELPRLSALMDANELARKMVDMPPNMATPVRMAEEAKKLAKLGVKVEVLGEAHLKKLGCNLMLAVGQGAIEESQMVIMHYNGGKKTDPVRALVGKGVMFDTGGYNMKPSGFMETMKCDMGGAAAVLGTMKALAERKAKVNVIGIMGCVVNKVSDRAFLPSDIITGYDGTTVEIGNTDAEGRLVLADCIAYAIDKYQPKELVNLATLTGAIMVALGGQYAGLFSTSDSMSEALTASGKTTEEQLWRMPIDDVYKAKTKLADLNNDGNRYGGSSTAACFLKHFAKKTPWAHLDIAGTAYPEKGVEGRLVNSGASGFGVRLLVNWLENVK